MKIKFFMMEKSSYLNLILSSNLKSLALVFPIFAVFMTSLGQGLFQKAM